MKDFICDNFAHHVGIPVAEIFDNDLGLSEIVARSEYLQNSLDLMEAFAKTANGLKKEYGIQFCLPAFSLDTSISSVLEVFLAEADKVEVRQGGCYSRLASIPEFKN